MNEKMGMTVKELIVELLNMPLDKEVLIETDDCVFHIEGIENWHRQTHIKFIDWRKETESC